MASCFFLLKQFEDVLIYLNSVKAYSYNDSTFNFNYGIAQVTAVPAPAARWCSTVFVAVLGVCSLCRVCGGCLAAQAACEYYKEAEEALLAVTDETIRSEYAYLSWLARCYMMNGKARDAWELYLKMESNTDSFAMLVLIANDCYKVGAFYYAAKAFDVLERLDPLPDYWEGKRGACCGVFQQVIARREKKEHLRDVVALLRNNSNTPQAEFMVRVMKKWANENGLNIV